MPNISVARIVPGQVTALAGFAAGASIFAAIKVV